MVVKALLFKFSLLEQVICVHFSGQRHQNLQCFHQSWHMVSLPINIKHKYVRRVRQSMVVLGFVPIQEFTSDALIFWFNQLVSEALKKILVNINHLLTFIVWFCGLDSRKNVKYVLRLKSEEVLVTGWHISLLLLTTLALTVHIQLLTEYLVHRAALIA